MQTRSLLLIATALCVVLVYSQTSAGQVYRWVDEDGQVHYSQTPPPDQDSEAAETVQVEERGRVNAACCREVRDFAVEIAGYMQQGLSIREVHQTFPPHSYPRVVEVANFVSARSRGEMSPAKVGSLALNACMNRRFQACRGGSGGRTAGAAGSGVAVGGSLLLTNHHVVRDCTGLTVGEDDVPARIVAGQPDVDLALLELDRPLAMHPPIRTAGSVRLGESVVVAGFPLGDILQSINVTTGTVSSDAGPGGNRGLFQFTAPVQPGSSGGPVLDRRGNLIGLVVARMNDGYAMRTSGAVPQNVNFAIKPEVVRAFLDANDIGYATGVNDSSATTESIAGEAREYTRRVFCAQ